MNKNQNKTIAITIHVLIWVGLLVLPSLVRVFTNVQGVPFDPKSLIMPLQIMVMFYLNYLFLINRLLFKKRVREFICVNLVIVLAASGFVMFVLHLFPPEHGSEGDPNLHKEMRLIPIVVNLIAQTLVIGLSVAIRMTGKWYEERQRVQVLERANTEAELQHLKSQLNPHFLFNSLNNIYALIAFDPQKAQLSLTNLCDLLRYELYETSRETIPLDKELDFVRSYCDLMRLRLSSGVDLQVDLADQNSSGIMIAPLLFVPVVENAFKHGVSQSGASYIHISILVDGHSVICTVSNSYYPKRDNDRSGSGIGLENLRRRLELLYPEQHMFTAQKQGDEFVARLTINLVQ